MGNPSQDVIYGAGVRDPGIRIAVIAQSNLDPLGDAEAIRLEARSQGIREADIERDDELPVLPVNDLYLYPTFHPEPPSVCWPGTTNFVDLPVDLACGPRSANGHEMGPLVRVHSRPTVERPAPTLLSARLRTPKAKHFRRRLDPPEAQSNRSDSGHTMAQASARVERSGRIRSMRLDCVLDVARDDAGSSRRHCPIEGLNKRANVDGVQPAPVVATSTRAGALDGLVHRFERA